LPLYRAMTGFNTLSHRRRCEHCRVAGGSFQIAKLIEQEQWMIAGAGVMLVQDAVFLFAMGGLTLESMSTRRPQRTPGMHAVDPLPERSASANRFLSAVSQRVSKRPIWLADAAHPARLCRRRSSASRDHGADARRRSHLRIRRDARTPTVASNRREHIGRSCLCGRRQHLPAIALRPSASSNSR